MDNQNIQQPKFSPPASSPLLTIEYAGFLQRFLAEIIDELAAIGVLILLGLSLRMLMKVVPAPTEYANIFQGLIISMKGIFELIIFLILLCFQIWNKVYLLGRTGGTIGKNALGVKVVKVENMKVIGMGTALLRETIGKSLSAVILNIGYLMILWDKRKQALHDKVANTIVIKKD